MWINSPLGKWDQDALVKKALGDAERRRMQAAAEHGNLVAGTGRLEPVRAWLRRQADPVYTAAHLVQSMIGTLVRKAREQQPASR